MKSFEVLDVLVTRVGQAMETALGALRKDADLDDTGAEFMFAGTASDGPYVIVIHPDLSTVLEDEQTLVAIGAGRMFAAALRQSLTHYLARSPAVQHALPLACRAVDSVCQVSAYGVATPVQMAVVDAEGARLLTAAEVGSVEEQVQAWLALETGTLYQSASEPQPDVIPRLQANIGDTTDAVQGRE